jgi:hypothetical protein
MERDLDQGCQILKQKYQFGYKFTGYDGKCWYVLWPFGNLVVPRIGML